MTLHLGFTGTRHGLSQHQGARVASQLDEHRPSVAHHGCCVGADEEFALIANNREWHIIGHPPSRSEFISTRALELCHEIMQPEDYARRNAAIVAASQIMIAAPLESTPQKRGGTWMTIRMARRALRAGKLQALYVVGRDGVLLDHTRWP